MTQDTVVPETDAETSTNMDAADAAEQIQLWMREGKGRRDRGDKSAFNSRSSCQRTA